MFNYEDEDQALYEDANTCPSCLNGEMYFFGDSYYCDYCQYRIEIEDIDLSEDEEE